MNLLYKFTNFVYLTLLIKSIRMKKIFITALCLFSILVLKAQNSFVVYEMKVKQEAKEPCSTF